MKRTTTTMKKQKLHLKRETVRTLDSLRLLAATELAAVNGGQLPPDTDSRGPDECSGSGFTSC
jgi:hypothetical protein